MISNTIIFYDIPSTALRAPWSPNTWKTRYSLNFKGTPYETKWVECPDIEATCKAICAQPTGKNPDGSPLYTPPAIYDPSTGAAVSDSTDIAIYLDAAYPTVPSYFYQGRMQFCMMFWTFIFSHLRPSSQSFFRGPKENILGMAIEDMTPRGKHRENEWAKVEKECNTIDSCLPRGGLFIMGSKTSFLDFVVASHVLTTKDLLEEKSKEWNDMKTWNGGRWLNILKSVEKYEVVI